MLFDGSCLMLYKCEFGNLAFFFQLMRKIQELLLASKDHPQNSLIWELQNTALETEIILIANFGVSVKGQVTVI